jgi:hypothetical protein
LSPQAWLYSYGGAGLFAIAIFAETPHWALGFAWVVFGCALFELAWVGKLRDLQWQAYALLAAGAFAGCVYAVARADAAWWPLAASVGLLYACALQSRSSFEAAGWLSFAASGCAAALFWRTLPHESAALAWAAIGLALDIVGARRALPQFKWQGPVFAVAALLSALALDIDPPRLAISIPTAALFYIALFTGRRAGEQRLALYYSLLGALLATTILFGRVSGGLLTVAWGLLGLGLLGGGFAVRERALRLEGLTLLLACILKLFLYDLRSLETIYRILSFVVLGLILLSVSWIYSRFRDQIGRLL